MDNTDWISVTKRRRTIKKDLLDVPQDPILPKLKIKPESLQDLIRKRIQMKVTQEKADILCGFARFTFKNIESNRLIPNDSQKLRIQRVFHVAIDIITLN